MSSSAEAKVKLLSWNGTEFQLALASLTFCSTLAVISSDICSSAVYRQLRGRPDQPGVLRFLFDHNVRDQKADDVLKVLLRQLLEQFEFLSLALLDKCLAHKKNGSEVGGKTWLELLKTGVSEFHKVSSNPIFILVDAYDEFLNRDNEDLERRRFREYIGDLNATGKSSILITTRDPLDQELATGFDSRNVKMQADGEDIDKFLDNEIDALNLQDKRKAQIKDTIKNQSGQWCSTCSSGCLMCDRFLMVTLQTRHVLEQRHDWFAMKLCLENLPKTPDDAYHGVLARLPEKSRKYAERILGWILHAERRLTMGELREALAIQIYGPAALAELDHHDESEATKILQISGGLVALDQRASLGFSHETVEAFLKKHQLPTLPSHSDLCRTCLTYLQLPVFENWCDRRRLVKRKDEFKFSDYAARYWGAHVIQSKADGQLELTILETFGSRGRREAIEQLRYRTRRRSLFSLDGPKSRSLLHIFIEKRLGSVFPFPLSGDEVVQGRHDSFPHFD
jgi:hypothetical protein